MSASISDKSTVNESIFLKEEEGEEEEDEGEGRQIVSSEEDELVEKEREFGWEFEEREERVGSGCCSGKEGINSPSVSSLFPSITVQQTKINSKWMMAM